MYCSQIYCTVHVKYDISLGLSHRLRQNVAIIISWLTTTVLTEKCLKYTCANIGEIHEIGAENARLGAGQREFRTAGDILTAELPPAGSRNRGQFRTARTFITAFLSHCFI
jgi:hypothetical protein